MYTPLDKFYITISFKPRTFTFSSSSYSSYLARTPSNRYYLGNNYRLLDLSESPKAHTKIEADTAIHMWQSCLYTLSVEIKKVKDEPIRDTKRTGDIHSPRRAPP